MGVKVPAVLAANLAQDGNIRCDDRCPMPERFDRGQSESLTQRCESYAKGVLVEIADGCVVHVFKQEQLPPEERMLADTAFQRLDFPADFSRQNKVKTPVEKPIFKGVEDNGVVF